MFTRQSTDSKKKAVRKFNLDFNEQEEEKKTQDSKKGSVASSMLSLD